MTLRQHLDDYHGYIVVHHDDSPMPVAILVDCGETVRIDDLRREPWTTEEAREIGRALIGWASRKEKPKNTAPPCHHCETTGSVDRAGDRSECPFCQGLGYFPSDGETA